MTMSALATDVMLPALPAMATVFGVSEATIQQVVSVFMIGYAIPQLLIGSLADRYGRRAVLLTGLGVYFVGSIICIAAPTLSWLLAGRFVQGLGTAVGPILSRAVLRDLYRGAELARMISYAMIVFAAAPLLAPSIGAMLLEVTSWEALFWFLLVVAVALMLLVIFVLPETLKNPDPNAARLAGIRRNVSLILKDPRSAWAIAFMTFVYGGLVAYLLAAPSLYIGYYDLTPAAFAIVFALVAGVSLLTQPINARLLRRKEPEEIVGVALPAYLIAGLLLLLLSLADLLTLPFFVAIMFGFFAAFSFIMGNGTTMMLDPHQDRAGVASGLLGFLQIALGTGIGALIAHFAADGPMALAVGFALLGLLAYPAYRLARRGAAAAQEQLTLVPQPGSASATAGAARSERKETTYCE